MAQTRPTSDSVLHTTTPEGITTITINRPHVRNAVDSATASKLYAAFQSFNNDASQKICIFSGADNTFCAGADLHQVSQSSSSSSSTSGNNNSNPRPLSRPVQNQNLAPMGPSRLVLSKPTIAVVSGHAVAGGLELSLLADLRIAEEGATFGVFCRRWGVPLIDGGTVRLPAIVGLGRAMDMILTGRAVDAAEALQMGLVNRVVTKGKGVEEAWRLARNLLQFPQICMNADRASAYYAVYEAGSFEDAMRNEFEKGIEVVEREGVKGAARFSSGEGRGGRFGGSKL